MSHLFGYHKVPKYKGFFEQVIFLNYSCILLWWFNGKTQKTKDTPLTLLCTLILELFPPICSVAALGISFGMYGLISSRQSHCTFAMNLFCTWVMNLVLQGGAEKGATALCVRQSQGRGSVCPPEPPLVLNEAHECSQRLETLGTVLWYWVWDQSLRNPSLPSEAQKH